MKVAPVAFSKGAIPSRAALGLVAPLVLLLCGPAVAQERTVRVGLYQNEPKVFADPSGRASGIFPDLLDQIAKDEGWTLVWEPGTWDEGLKALTEGRVDLMPDVAFSDDRDQRYDFHRTPVAESWSYVYAAPNSGISRLSNLDGKRVAVLRGSIQETLFAQLANGFGLHVTMVPASSLTEAFQQASDGRAEGAIANHLFGDYFDHAHGLERTPVVFNSARLYFVTAQGRNPDLLLAVDRHLDAWLLEPDSLYYRTLNRYTAGESTSGFPRYLLWVLVAISGLLAIAGGAIQVLRWQVRGKVRHLVEAGRALHESELKHRMLFETAGDAILLMRQDRFVDCNARTLALFGCGREQIIGAPPYQFSPPLQPDGRASEEAALEKIGLALKEGPQSFEWEHCRLDRSPFAAEVTLNRLDLGGDVLVQAIVRDVTRRKRAEAELKVLYQEVQRHAEVMEERVLARTAQLAEKVQELKDFAYTVSHDLKAPLRGIAGYANELDKKHRAGLTERAHFCLTQILTATSHLDQLIEDLLRYSRLDTETPSATGVDPGRLVQMVLRDRELTLQEHHVEVTVDVPPVTLRTWERGLVQVLSNLIDNAIKYSGKAVPPRLRIQATSAKGTWRVAVSDNGIGFDMKYHDRIFKLFNRLVRMEEFEGTGAGLAITKKVLDKQGGRIWAESAPGQGATFFVELPMPADDGKGAS